MYVGYDWIAKPRHWVAAVGEVFMANEYAMLQYREGSYGEAVEALSAYIEFLNRQKPSSENWKPGENPWLDERGSEQTRSLHGHDSRYSTSETRMILQLNVRG